MTSKSESEHEVEHRMDTTEIGMRVARALGKRNLLNEHFSLEVVAKVIDEVANIPLILDMLSNMDGAEVIDKITSASARRASTF